MANFRVGLDVANIIVGAVALTAYLFTSGEVQTAWAICFAISYWITVFEVTASGIQRMRASA